MPLKLKVGDVAPDFELIDSGLKTVKLSDYKGKKVVVTFFPMAFSGGPEEGCERHLCSLKTIKGAEVLGVSSDLVFANKAFEHKLELPFKLLSDPNGKLTDSYVDFFDIGTFLADVGVAEDVMRGTTTYPRALYVIGEDGTVVYTWIGEENGATHPGIMPILKEIHPFTET
ncbi:hypothetical protein NDN08_005662 [Rhodosorus marinus]|uniref:Thioredoxin domain-containing protein n=1 Tax=Rhodosorus marinus TaxID=101924 RepID=A0AAV8V4S9_9RHOD|nr:hypothetical protein NDN08_005662 [Rhodosorus marinus]